MSPDNESSTRVGALREDPDARVWLARRIAFHAAIDAGLDWQASEDCASDFVAHLLKDSRHRLDGAPDEEGRYRAWLRRCAANFLCNYQRSLARTSAHVVAWPSGSEEDLTLQPELAQPARGPEAQPWAFR